LACILEPFIPSFSAKVYKQFNLTRTEQDEVLIEVLIKNPDAIRTLIPAGHKIGKPAAIFEKYDDGKVEEWKKQFSGKKK